MEFMINGKPAEIRMAIEVISKETGELNRITYCDPADIDMELQKINRKYCRIGKITIANYCGILYKEA